MRTFYFLLALVFLCSYTIKNDTVKLENGTYKAELDVQYKKKGLYDFEFTLQDDEFILNFKGQIANLKIEWQNDSEFIVKGFTQPLKPTEEEQELLRNKYAFFKIEGRKGNITYFSLKHTADHVPIYKGKFIKQ
jgi:hypothetical protein